MDKKEQTELINGAAQKAYEAGIDPEMDPISAYLVSIGHRYAGDFNFVFCVACEVADMSSRSRGFKSQSDEAMTIIMERRTNEARRERLLEGSKGDA